MNSKEMAESYLMEGEIRLKTARTALEEEHFAYAIRQSQDVGIILRKESERFPAWFTKNLDRLTLISRELRREREPSRYGDSELNLPHAKD